MCWTYGSDAERQQVLDRYVHTGLRDRCRVVYQPGSTGPGSLLAGGVDVAGAVRRGALRIRNDSNLDPALWMAEVEAARRDGFTGLRAVADLSWAAGHDRIGWYERQLNRVFADGFGMAVCLYDRRSCCSAHLCEVARAHPYTVTAWIPDREPLLRMIRSDAGLRLSGEADLSNRDALATLLGHLLEDAGTRLIVTIDLAGLRFADASTCELIVRTGHNARGRLRTTGARPQVHRLLTLAGGAHVPGLL